MLPVSFGSHTGCRWGCWGDRALLCVAQLRSLLSFSKQCTIGVGSKQPVAAAMANAHLSLSCAVRHLTGQAVLKSRPGAKCSQWAPFFSAWSARTASSLGVILGFPILLPPAFPVQSNFFPRLIQLLSDSGKIRETEKNENWSEWFWPIVHTTETNEGNRQEKTPASVTPTSITVSA